MARDWLDTPYDLRGKRVWVAGHTGMVGSAMLRRLADEDCDVLTVERDELDLREQADVRGWMAVHKPQVVVVTAAKVGGIGANFENPAPFFYDNMMIASNIIHSSHQNNTGRLLFLGSSCIYPRDCVQPIKEESLLCGALEATNEAYALAKIGGLKMVEYYRRQYGCDFISAMPCNLFGVGDTYDAENSHVIPAMIVKAHEAKIRGDDVLTLWGSGAPLREFLYVDELADALVYLLKNYSGDAHINVGSGTEISIKCLAQSICEVVGFKGIVKFDSKKPDGTSRKMLDTGRLMSVGWKNEMWQKKGMMKCLEECYGDFLGRYNYEDRSRV